MKIDHEYNAIINADLNHDAYDNFDSDVSDDSDSDILSNAPSQADLWDEIYALNSLDHKLLNLSYHNNINNLDNNIDSARGPNNEPF